jgi:hypothetical protein
MNKVESAKQAYWSNSYQYSADTFAGDSDVTAKGFPTALLVQPYSGVCGLTQDVEPMPAIQA